MWVRVLVVAGVLLLPVPALVVGARGVLRRTGLGVDERTSYVLLVLLRAVVWLLVLALSAVTLLSGVGALIKDVDLPSLVYVFFVLDLLLAALIVLTFGRRERPRPRRRATPAPR